MEKKNINRILISLIFISLLTTVYAFYTIYKTNKKIDTMALITEKEINNNLSTNIEKTTNETKTNTNNSNNAIGLLIFESGKKIAIYNNPTDYNMKIGIGKITNNSVLNTSGNSILLGHNDSSFTELKNIKIGDIITIKTTTKILNYKVNNTYITKKDDPTPYKSTEDTKLTLITCYPFNYIISTPSRYIVEATPIYN